MPWLQVKLEIAPEQAEFLEDQLLAAGAAAVTYQDSEDQPIFEPDLGTTPLWSQTVITGLFDAEYDMDAVKGFITQQCQAHYGDNFKLHLKAEILEDKDWEREWMENYHPMQFGQRLWVCPSWRDVPDVNAVNLMLDPGLAFGTGTHPTTALCLEWLDGQPLEGKTVIDYGCGSGILGIASLLLGAESALGVDIDPQALQASRDNLERNKLPLDAMPVYLPEDAPQGEADLVVANILAGPLAQLAPTLAAHVKPGGQILLSGLLAEQAKEVSDVYRQWFEMQPAVEKEGWIRLSGTRIG